MISILDYGLGNIKAISNIYKKLNIQYNVVNDVNDLDPKNKFILPGVGSFDWAISKLNKSGMRSRIEDFVMNKQTYILGICVGMQILANSSEEGNSSGLGFINGEVKKFSNYDEKILLPHLGWNSVSNPGNNSIFKDIKKLNFFFLHSYYFLPKSDSYSIGITSYDINFSSAIQKGNIYGMQFHPEKSHSAGIKLLKNFALL